MDLADVQLLCLEQTQDFLDLPCLTHYDDHSLSVFYHASLSNQAKAHLPAICPDEDTSPTPNPESSRTPPREKDTMPEPTTDGEPAPEGATEYVSDQVCEPAISCIAVGDFSGDRGNGVEPHPYSCHCE